MGLERRERAKLDSETGINSILAPEPIIAGTDNKVILKLSVVD